MDSSFFFLVIVVDTNDLTVVLTWRWPFFLARISIIRQQKSSKPSWPINFDKIKRVSLDYS